MTRYFLFLPAALLLAACGDAAKTDSTVSRPPAADPATTAAAPPKPAEAPAAPIPSLMLESGSGQTFASTGGTFEQLAETKLPSFADDEKFSDSPALAQVQGVRRESTRLLLKPANGPEVALQNNDADSYEEFVKYRYWGELPTAHQWVVAIGLYEGSATMLVDQRTGAKKYVWGRPSVSPDGHHIFTASGDLGAGYDPNGVQLYRVGPDSLTLVGERKFTQKEPQTGRWVNNHAVVLELRDADFRPGVTPKQSYLGLELARP